MSEKENHKKNGPSGREYSEVEYKLGQECATMKMRKGVEHSHSSCQVGIADFELSTETTLPVSNEAPFGRDVQLFASQQFISVDAISQFDRSRQQVHWPHQSVSAFRSCASNSSCTTEKRIPVANRGQVSGSWLFPFKSNSALILCLSLCAILFSLDYVHCLPRKSDSVISAANYETMALNVNLAVKHIRNENNDDHRTPQWSSSKNNELDDSNCKCTLIDTGDNKPTKWIDVETARAWQGLLYRVPLAV